MMKIQKHARNKYVNQKQVYALHHKVIVEHCKRVIPLVPRPESRTGNREGLIYTSLGLVLQM